jgi:hypothetical protein
VNVHAGDVRTLAAYKDFLSLRQNADNITGL